MTDNVVTQALQAEYIRVRNKRDGAEKRLVYAESQVELETGLMNEAQANLDLLETAILAAGGTVPPVEGEPPPPPEPVPAADPPAWPPSPPAPDA